MLSLWLAACGEQPPQSASDSLPESIAEPDQRAVILFMGDSLTAGYHLDPAVAYPALIQRKLDERGLQGRVVNAGVSGDTSADGRHRIHWLLRQPIDTFVLALGANDALRGLPIAQLKDNLSATLAATQAAHPDALLVVAGMRMPTNLGPEYTEAFEQVFRDLAHDFDALLIPFLLEGVGGQPDLNLSDGIHPNTAGHQLIAQTVWTHLSSALESRLAP